MASMAIGPVLPLAGNEVQVTTNGKLRITNSEGKVKTLSQNQFKKQFIKNFDKIAAGDEVEFKDNKKSLIAAAATGAAVIGTLAALGIAHKKGALTVKSIKKNDVLLKKAAIKVNNAAEFVGRKIHKYSSNFVDFVKKYAPKAKEKIEDVTDKTVEKVKKVTKAKKNSKAAKA